MPEQNDKCSRNAKTCFFGSQACPYVGEFPMKKCFCGGVEGTRTWDCIDTVCPSEELGLGIPFVADSSEPLPPPGKRSCPRKKHGFQIYNDDVCPSETPLGSSEKCTSDHLLKCSYGKKNWYVQEEFLLSFA
jgi:hypothetical protein